MQNRWQYFFKSQVLRGFSPGASDQPMPTEGAPDNMLEFLAIMQGYIEAMLGKFNPHVTQTVLTSLQSLHERWRLFNRNFFKMNLLHEFLNAVLRLLLSPHGGLHQDQLINLLFNMAMVDEAALQNAFVAIGYIPNTNCVLEICRAKVSESKKKKKFKMYNTYSAILQKRKILLKRNFFSFFFSFALSKNRISQHFRRRHANL